MSWQIDFQDPVTDKPMPGAVAKMTAGRFHDDESGFGWDGIEVTMFDDVASSHGSKSRIKFDISELLAMAPPEKDEDGKDVPATTTLSQEAKDRVKDAMKAQLYTEYSAIGILKNATKV